MGKGPVTPDDARSTAGSPRLLLVDDDLETLDALGASLEHDGYACARAASGLEALQLLARQQFDAIVSDVRLGEMSGLELLDRVVALDPSLPVILCTGFGALADAVDATKRGAFQYLQKPYDSTTLARILTTALQGRTSADGAGPMRSTARGRARPPHLLVAPTTAVGPRLLGSSPAMLVLQQSIASVAASSSPVLIHGESGTGKDLVARAIHGASPRRSRPLVAVNVSAIPEHLLESELFGHVRGAFTGASEARRGLLAEAHGGTLFLDEIGDMPIGLQAKLLRVLQSGELRPVGSDDVRHVDVRVVTATHRDLVRSIEQGKFREDLYFRIRVLPIEVPALRNRRGDIVELARWFLEAAKQRTPTSPVRSLSAAAERILEHAPWPGNVRELEGAMERLVVFGKEATVQAADLRFLAADRPPTPPPAELTSLRQVSEQHVALVLHATRGDKRRAAAILGIDLSTLYRWQQRQPKG